MKDATLKQAVKFLEIFGNLSTEKMQEIFGSGLLADLRDGDVKNVNRDAVRKLLNLPPSENQPINLLEFLGTITLPARTKKFVVRDHFVVDKSKKAKVKISYLGDNLKANFLGKIEEPIAESTLHYGKLLRGSLDRPIIDEIGGADRCETTLAEMFGLMELQPNGEDGTLLTNGYANIFYIRDINGVLWAVGCHWDDDGWHVLAHSLGNPHDWDADSQVFFCNSSIS